MMLYEPTSRGVINFGLGSKATQHMLHHRVRIASPTGHD